MKHRSFNLATVSRRVASVLTCGLLWFSGLVSPADEATNTENKWQLQKIAAPVVVTIDLGSDLPAYDLCWSDHADAAKQKIVDAAIGKMRDPKRLYVIRVKNLTPFFRLPDGVQSPRDMRGEDIVSSNNIHLASDYPTDVEMSLLEIAKGIRGARPGAKLAFDGFGLQPRLGRSPAYEKLATDQDFLFTDQPIDVDPTSRIAELLLRIAFTKVRMDWAAAHGKPLAFANNQGESYLALSTTAQWPRKKMEVEIASTWDGSRISDDSVGDAAIVADKSRILIPGDGFPEGWGASVPAIGTPDDDGYDAKAIARWNVVPYQTVEDNRFTVGVVAFHINHIDRVEFYLEGGSAVTVTEMTHNPRTDTWEYWAIIDPAVMLASDFPDGPIELRAIAYPQDAGEPRILDSLLLNTNTQQTLPSPTMWCSPSGSDETGDGSQGNPFRQPYRAMRAAHVAGGGGPGGADGASVYLLAGKYQFGEGSYPYPQTRHRWATVQAAPGVDAAEVIFTSSSSAGFKTRLIAVKNVTFFDTKFNTAGGGSRHAWIDNSLMIGLGDGTNFSPFLSQHWDSISVTNTRIRGVRHAARGTLLTRNVHAEDLLSDAFTDSRLVVNSSVVGINRRSTENHPDVYQFSGSDERDNTIIYGLKARNVRAQGIFSSSIPRVDNTAFVNVLIAMPLDHEPKKPLFSQWQTRTNHLLLHGVSLPNSTFLFRSPEMSNISVRGSHFYRVLTNPVAKNQWFHGNHFTDTSASGSLWRGTNATFGDPSLADFDGGDFTPLADSPLRGRLRKPVARIDVNGEKRSMPDTIGAIR